MIAFCGVDCAACPDYREKNCLCRDEVGAVCPIVTCCHAHGVLFCGRCPEFPCADMRAFYEESDSHRAAGERMRAVHEEMKGRLP